MKIRTQNLKALWLKMVICIFGGGMFLFSQSGYTADRDDIKKPKKSVSAQIIQAAKETSTGKYGQNVVRYKQTTAIIRQIIRKIGTDKYKPKPLHGISPKKVALAENILNSISIRLSPNPNTHDRHNVIVTATVVDTEQIALKIKNTENYSNEKLSQRINEAISRSIEARLAKGEDFQIGNNVKKFKSAFKKFARANSKASFKRNQNAKIMAQIKKRVLRTNGLAKLSYVREKLANKSLKKASKAVKKAVKKAAKTTKKAAKSSKKGGKKK